MPTVLRKNGFRFFFYSNEGTEPPHIHVIGHGGEAKVWLEPVKFSYSSGLKQKDRSQILRIVLKNLRLLREDWRRWHESKS